MFPPWLELILLQKWQKALLFVSFMLLSTHALDHLFLSAMTPSRAESFQKRSCSRFPSSVTAIKWNMLPLIKGTDELWGARFHWIGRLETGSQLEAVLDHIVECAVMLSYYSFLLNQLSQIFPMKRPQPHLGLSKTILIFHHVAVWRVSPYYTVWSL